MSEMVMIVAAPKGSREGRVDVVCGRSQDEAFFGSIVKTAS